MTNINLIPWYWIVVGIIFLTTLLVVVGLLLVRRFANQKILRKDQAIASYALNTIALMYCVIMGFVVIKVQERHAYVRDTVTKEANLLLNLYYSSCEVFPPKVCADIRTSVQQYARDVVYNEWPMMVEGKDLALAFPSSVQGLWKVFDSISPEDQGQLARYQESLSKLNELTEARFERQSNVERNESAFMWAVLIYGGVLVVVSSFLFASSSLLEHMFQLIFISSFISLVLLLIYFLDSPYTGPTAIHSTPFEKVLDIIEMKHKMINK